MKPKKIHPRKPTSMGKKATKGQKWQVFERHCHGTTEDGIRKERSKGGG